MKGRRLTKRVLGFVLTLAMAFTLIPQVEAKAANDTITVQTTSTMTVLTPLTGGTSLSNGQTIYIADCDSADMTGQLPSAVSAKVSYTTGTNYASNYIHNFDGGALNYVRYFHVEVRARDFDWCPNGALVSADGSNWKHFCDGSGKQNVVVKPYVAYTSTGTMNLTIDTAKFTFEGTGTHTITKDDIQGITYHTDRDGTLDDFRISPSDNTISPTDNTVTIEYGLNYTESMTIEVPLTCKISFDTQGGQAGANTGDQMILQYEKVTQPANPTRADHVFLGWTKTAGGNDFWNFETDGVDTVRTLYARWKHVQEVTASDAELTYGNNQRVSASCLGDSTLSYTVTNGTNVIEVSSNGTITTKNVGDAKIKVEASETETTLGGSKTIDVHVEKRDVKLYANDKQKVYGTDDPALTFSVDNTTPLANGDIIATAFAGALTREEGDNAGTYAINGDAITSANYNIVSFTPGTFTVSKRPVKVTADDKHTVYGLPDEELTFTATGLTGVEASGLVGDDELNIQLMRLPLNSAGEYTITPIQAEGANPNYDVALVTGTYTIHTTDVVIKDIVAQDKEYDGTDEAVVSAVVEGVNGEKFVIENLKGTFDTKNVVFTEDGDYAEQTVTLSGVICEDTGSFVNYTYNGIPFAPDAELPSTTAKIYPRKINVIAFDDEKYYGEDDPDLEWGLDDLSSIPGWEDLKDIVDVTLTRMPGEVLGSYSIIISGKSKDPNYDISFKSGRMKIARMESEALFEVETSREIEDDVDLAQSNDELLNMILSDKEKKMVEDGASVRVWFEVDPAQEITAQELFVITLGLPKGYNIGANYDINLFKKFSHLDKEQMHETPSGVGFSIKVPDELLKNVPAGMERTFTLIRVHDGVAQEIPCTYDPETGCIIFESSKFSIYTIAYKDSVVKSEKDAAVKTGDSAPVQKMLAMMVGAGFAIALLTYKRRKEDEMI